VQEAKEDCLDFEGEATGVKTIRPYRIPEGLQLKCDMDTDGGGWAVRYHGLSVL